MIRVRFGATITAADVARAKADNLPATKQRREFATMAQLGQKAAEDTWEGSKAKKRYEEQQEKTYQHAAKKDSNFLKKKYKEITGIEWVG